MTQSIGTMTPSNIKVLETDAATHGSPCRASQLEEEIRLSHTVNSVRIKIRITDILYCIKNQSGNYFSQSKCPNSVKKFHIKEI